MWEEIFAGLDEADVDDEVSMAILTETGDFYSSGNFFGANMQMVSKYGKPTNVTIFVDKLFSHRKILIALVNGPAIGIACTSLACFDLVLASDSVKKKDPDEDLGLLPQPLHRYRAVSGGHVQHHVLENHGLHQGWSSSWPI